MESEAPVNPSSPSTIDFGLVRDKLFTPLVEKQVKHQSYFDTAKSFFHQPDASVGQKTAISITTPDKDGAVLGVEGEEETFVTIRLKGKELRITSFHQDKSTEHLENLYRISQPDFQAQIEKNIPQELLLKIKNRVKEAWFFYLVGPDEKGHYHTVSTTNKEEYKAIKEEIVSSVAVIRYTDPATGSDSIVVYGNSWNKDKRLTIAKATNLPEVMHTNAARAVAIKTKELTEKKEIMALEERLQPLTDVSILGDQYRPPKKTKLQRALGEDRFTYWLTKAWPADRLGEINPVTLGIISQLRNRMSLTESSLPDITEVEIRPRKVKRREFRRQREQKVATVSDKIAQAVTSNQRTINILESQLAASFIDQLAKTDFEEIASLYASYYQKKHGRQRWLKNFSDSPEKLAQLREEFKKEVESSPLEFFREFYGNNRDIQGIKLGQQATASYQAVLTELKKERSNAIERQRFLTSDFSPQLREAARHNSLFHSLLDSVPKKDGKTAYELSLSGFYDAQGKPKNKFAHWIISGWQSMYGPDKFDPLAIGILWYFQEDLGLTEATLPDRTQALEDRQKITQLISQLKPLVDRIEQAVAPTALDHYKKKGLHQEIKVGEEQQFFLKFVSRNPNVRSFDAGVYLGSLVKDIYQKEYLGREEEFARAQEKRLGIFEKMMDGEYHGQRSEVANRCYRALYGLSHLRKKLAAHDEEKLPEFADKTERVLRKLNKIGFTATRLIQKTLSSPEGESMFKPIKKAPGKRLLGSVAAGVALAEGYRLWAGINESSLNRPTQLVLLATGFLAGRSNFLKDIRWSNVGKSVLRGLTSYGLMHLTYAAIQKTGLLPDTNLLANIPLQATIAKQVASNTLNLLGLNFGSEWMVNELINQKHIPDRLTEYLYFQLVDPTKRAEEIYQSEKSRLEKKSEKLTTKVGDFVKRDRGRERLYNWTEVIDFMREEKQTPLQLLRAARALKHSQEILMALMIHNPTRYRKRVVTFDGHRHLIDNQKMLVQLSEVERQLHHKVTHQVGGDDRKRILSLLEETETKPLERRLPSRLGKTRTSMFIATNTTNLAFLMAFRTKELIDLYGNHVPWLKKLADQTQEVIDTAFGKVTSHPPQISVSAPAHSVSEIFSASEQTSYSDMVGEVNQRAERLYTFLQVYGDQNVDPAIKHLLLEEYKITPEQVDQLNLLLTKNNLTPEDLHIYFQLSNVSGVNDDFITSVAQKLGGSQHGDVGRLVDALTEYQDRLNLTIAQSVRTQRITDDLYQYANHQNQPLLERLGIDSQSFDYQLDLVPGLTDQIKKQILEAKEGFWLEGRNLIVKASPDSFIMAQLPDHQTWQGSFDQSKTKFILDELGRLYHSAPSDFNLSLQNPHYSFFMGKVYETFDNNWHNFDEKAFFSSLPSEKSGYFQELLALSSKVLGEQKAKTVLEAAARGDPAAFNTLYNTIANEYPGQIANLFEDSYREKTPLENIVSLIRTSGSPDQPIDKSKLVFALQAYSKDLYLDYTGNTYEPSWPTILQTMPAPSQVDLGQLLNGNVSLEKGIITALRSYKMIFTSQGQVIGQMSSSLQVSRGDFPAELVAYVDNLEGPLRDDPDQFLVTLFGRNMRALADKVLEKVGIDLWNVDLSGASDPAMQLSKLLLNNMLPENHQQQYSTQYLAKLILAVHDQRLPTEMSYLINPNVTQSSLSGTPPQTSSNLAEWAKLFGVERQLTESPAGETAVKLAESIRNIPNDAVKELCYKLEQYLIAQRLISLYGIEEVYRNYLNFVYLGSPNGVPIYGLEAGAQFFLGKSVNQLTQGEQLLLIGLIQQPNGYSPLRKLTPEEITQGFTSADQITRNVANGLVNRLVGKGIVNDQQALLIKNQIAGAHFVNQTPEALANKIPDEAQTPLAAALAQPTPTANTPIGTVIEIISSQPQPIVSPLISPLPATSDMIAIHQSSVDSFFNPLQTTLEVSTPLEAVQTPQTIDEYAYILTKIFNETGGKRGQELTDYIVSELNKYHIDSSRYPELQTALRDLSGETSIRPLQCMVADNFFTALPFSGSEHVADLGGWTKVTEQGLKGLEFAKEYVHDLFVSGQELMSKGNTILMKLHNVDQFHVGDHFATDSPYQVDGAGRIIGHMGVIVKTGIDSEGKHYALIFDANYFNNGQTRLVKVTDDNVFQLLARAPEGKTAPIGIIRLNEAYENNPVIPTSIVEATDRSATIPLTVHSLESPIKQVDVPVFEDLVQNPDGSLSVIRNPGLAMVMYNADGQRLAEFNPTGILGRVPILPGSTIKPFIYAFLVSKGIDPNAQIAAIPGQYALDGHIMPQAMTNPYDLLNSYSYDNTLSLNQALAFSANIPFEEEMWRLSKNNPELWVEFQEFLRRFGLEMTDIYGDELRKPTSLAAIGSDAYVRSLNNLANAYAILANPEKYFNSSQDVRLLSILHQTREVLMNDSLKATPSNTGFVMSEYGRNLLSSTCNGVTNSCAFKTGTVGGIFNGEPKTTGVLTVGLIKNGDQFVVAAAIEAGQRVENGQKIEVDLEDIVPSAYGSMMVLPWIRTLLEKTFKP